MYFKDLLYTTIGMDVSDRKTHVCVIRLMSFLHPFFLICQPLKTGKARQRNILQMQ